MFPGRLARGSASTPLPPANNGRDSTRAVRPGASTPLPPANNWRDSTRAVRLGESSVHPADPYPPLVAARDGNGIGVIARHDRSYGLFDVIHYTLPGESRKQTGSDFNGAYMLDSGVGVIKSVINS